MTLKLTYQQAEALIDQFNYYVLPTDSNTLDAQLVLLHMVAIYKKLRNKWEGEAKKVYSLSLTEYEMVAYYIYWRDNQLVRGSYEWAFLLDHCMQIDKEISNKRRNFKTDTTKYLNN